MGERIVRLAFSVVAGLALFVFLADHPRLIAIGPDERATIYGGAPQCDGEQPFNRCGGMNPNCWGACTDTQCDDHEFCSGTFGGSGTAWDCMHQDVEEVFCDATGDSATCSTNKTCECRDPATQPCACYSKNEVWEPPGKSGYDSTTDCNNS